MDRILRRREVEETIGMSTSWIYLAMNRGEFPKPIKLSSRAVGWTQSSIESWLEKRQ